MITISRILCPTDFSDLSKNALAQAVALARWYEAEITLLYVAPVAITAAEVAYVPGPWLSPEMREKLRGDLHAFAQSAREEGVTVRVDLCEGNPATEILDAARTEAFDLIVMGTHGRHGLEAWALGSVTESVLRASPCPVLTIAPRSRLAPTARFDTILCPVDFSPTSERTAHEAGLLAAETQSRLVLFHVIERVSGPPTPVPPGFDRKAYRADAEDSVRRRLRRLAADHRDVPEASLAWGWPDREILRSARERSAGLIVMGAHGGPMDSTLFGSTAHKVVRRASCPVLVLPARAHALREAEPEPVGVGSEE
ncbi:MAG TPA: universal stress protein [Vicinamibacteria bacterium]|nr:universal stress protein [Vicinamibacteria bacterium]